MPAVQRLDDNFVSQLDEIDRWLASLGIRQHNRFRIYKENLIWPREHDAEKDRASVYQQIEADGRLTEQ